MAITITALKHRNMQTSSRGIIGSLSSQNATIEMKDGLVCQNIKTKIRGANGAARLKNMKFACPVKILAASGPFC